MCRNKIYPIIAFQLNIISVLSEETEIIQPFLLGCDTKSLRVVQISLTALQRLISHQAISEVTDFSSEFLITRRAAL